MADAPGKIVEIGLVLQGGGALGAYECGGVAALLELMDDAQAAGRAIVLKSVAGVSVGAINAACVVGSLDWADARRRIAALWDDLTLATPPFWPRQAQRDLSLFGLPGFYWPRSDFVNAAAWTSFYDTAPLRATLARHIDFEALNKSDTVFVVTAVDVESGQLTNFCNHVLDGEAATEVAPEHVMASGALPPQFPWIKIKGRSYWDGGLVDNAPLDDAIAAFSHGEGVSRVLVVMDLYPLRARLPRKLSDVEDRAHELSFGNRMRQDRETARRLNEFVATIDELAALAPAGAISDDLAARVAWARSFKTIKIVNIDMQNPGGGIGPQDPSDDECGLRDFSSETVSRRREAGYRIARERLAPVLAGA
jgi:predicted acylesterase/phospholipase RssA